MRISATTLIRDIPFSGLDFESAGMAPGDTDVPIQVGIVTSSMIPWRPKGWMSYIHTDKEILWSASKVHGIHKSDLENAPTFIDLWADIKSRLFEKVIVGHNIATEKRFLRQFPGSQFGPWVDTLVLSRACLPDLKDYGLSSVCSYLGVEDKLKKWMPKGRWHDALYDAGASLLVLKTLVTALKLNDAPLGVLGSAVKD